MTDRGVWEPYSQSYTPSLLKPVGETWTHSRAGRTFCKYRGNYNRTSFSQLVPSSIHHPLPFFQMHQSTTARPNLKPRTFPHRPSPCIQLLLSLPFLEFFVSVALKPPPGTDDLLNYLDHLDYQTTLIIGKGTTLVTSNCIVSPSCHQGSSAGARSSLRKRILFQRIFVPFPEGTGC